MRVKAPLTRWFGNRTGATRGDEREKKKGSSGFLVGIASRPGD
jgi:hypothetical protein